MLLFCKNSNEIAIDVNSLVGQTYLAPMVQRIIDLEAVVAAQGGTLQGMIGNTQTAVENEMQKVKTVTDSEVNRVNDITNSENAYAAGQMKALENIRDEWQGTSKALRVEYSQLIAEDKVELENDKKHVKQSGQTLVTEVQRVQQIIKLSNKA